MGQDDLAGEYSSPAQIAEVVYEAATDGKDHLRYVAGADAKPPNASSGGGRSVPKGDKTAILPAISIELNCKGLHPRNGSAEM
jgi:hypothetical protein